MATAAYYIDKLGLSRHVEGGSFKETYRSSMMLDKSQHPSSFHDHRNVSTAIYFLLEHGQFSAFHRIASDEMWHFYDGAPLVVYEILNDGTLRTHHLGKNLEAGETFQCVIGAGSWFASRCETPDAFSLVGCTVAPGFDFEDFELADRSKPISEYPQHQSLITQLTY